MTAKSDPILKDQPDSVTVVDEELFRNLIARRASMLFKLIDYMQAHDPVRPAFTRPFIGDLLAQAVHLEELLDAYGARNNRHWCRFRGLTAAIKLFTKLSYELLHIQHVLPNYRLLPIEKDFVAATEQALVFTSGIVKEAAVRLLKQVKRLGLPVVFRPIPSHDYREQLIPGRLSYNRDKRQIDNVAAIVTHLATAFLNLAAESELLHDIAQLQPATYASCFPDPVSEENLRYLKHRFHNLQSVYDTYVSETEIERLDADLPILRGHASIIYHLLDIATDLAHYYERHLNPHSGDSALRQRPVVDSAALQDILIGFSLTYSNLYLDCGQRLCQEMLKRYAEVGQIEVPAPHYRGFHVRPATLVARIVLHYGSTVRMELEGDTYDASSPLDLFRANEKINARKRRWLAAEIARLPLREDAIGQDQIKAAVLDRVLKLAEDGKLIIYEQPLQLSTELTELSRQEKSLLERVNAEIARLLAIGQIDISTGLTIKFTGDKRVLADIALLAENGYGEDSFGNNIPLPKTLSYLRRSGNPLGN